MLNHNKKYSGGVFTPPLLYLTLKPIREIPEHKHIANQFKPSIKEITKAASHNPLHALQYSQPQNLNEYSDSISIDNFQHQQ